MTTQLLDVKDYALVANVTTKIAIPSRFFQLMASSADVTIEFLRSHSVVGRAENVPEGFVFGPVSEERAFHEVWITSTIGQTVKVALARDEARLARIVGNITATVSKPTVIDTVADVAMTAGVATLIVAANAARRAALISNLTANANIMRIGDSNVGAARGVECAPGQTITMEGTEAIYGFSAGAQNVGVAVIQD